MGSLEGSSDTMELSSLTWACEMVRAHPLPLGRHSTALVNRVCSGLVAANVSECLDRFRLMGGTMTSSSPLVWRTVGEGCSGTTGTGVSCCAPKAAFRAPGNTAFNAVCNLS